MKWTAVVAVFAVVALVIPAMAFAQAAPTGAWCGGSYGAEGTNFGPCMAAQTGAQVAGQASGIQAQSGPTEPQYPADQVSFDGGQAFFNKQPLSLSYKPTRDRTGEVEAE
jgi:hypothetical protein